MKPQSIILLLLFFLQVSLFSKTLTVTTNADSGNRSLRQAILDINNGSDSSNTINLRVPGNSAISINSDLPTIQKNTSIDSLTQQPIDGNGKYRLFATIMADLALTNCTLQNGAAIGGGGGASSGGGLGCGGGIYIDRGNKLSMTNIAITKCKAQGGKGEEIFANLGGGGASFCTSKIGNDLSAGGDYPGYRDGKGGSYDQSLFLSGYGGGDSITNKGGGNGAAERGKSGYCGGGGSGRSGSGGNGGGDGTKNSGGGGGFGSGGCGPSGGGGGFGGGGCNGGGGGLGGGGSRYGGKGGNFGGDVPYSKEGGGGGAGLGGALFIGDSASVNIEDGFVLTDNKAIGGKGGDQGNPGQGYAPDIFLFQKAQVYFNNEQPLIAPFSIQSDLKAPVGHLDSGIVKRGFGLLTLSNIQNNYQGGTEIQAGTLSIADPRALGSPKGAITLSGGILQPSANMILENPIKTSSSGITRDYEKVSLEQSIYNTGGLDIPEGVTLTTIGDISGHGPITKTNKGTWEQRNTATHTGELNISEGIFQINGTLPSDIYVSSGAMIEGTGIASGRIINNGILAPGDHQIGTFTISGNYQQNSEGLLKIKISPSGKTNKLVVFGTAHIDGMIDVQFTPGIYPKMQKYNLIDCKGELIGLFNEALFSPTFHSDFEFMPTDLNLVVLSPQILLPIPSNQLPRNQKKLAKYLFCDNFPFENDDLVELLQNLFQLSIPEYCKVLATLTPQHYGALPIGESRCIEYLLRQNSSSCRGKFSDGQYSFTLLPLYYRNNIQSKDSHLPNYQQNTGGFRIQYSMYNPTNIAIDIGGSFLHTYTKWEEYLGNADSNGAYVDTKVNYNKDNFCSSLGILGGYSYVSVRHNIFLGHLIKAQSNPHYWDFAGVLSAKYTARYNCISFIPTVNLTQTNVFLSSIYENQPKELKLQANSKHFGFLDALLSLKIQLETQAICNSIKAYVDFGWHNIKQLSSRNFYSRLGNFIACKSSFTTRSYKGSVKRLFSDWGGTISYCPGFELFFNYKIESTKGDKIQAFNLGTNWKF